MPHHPRIEAPSALDGFDVLDACHRQSLLALGKLSALVTRLDTVGADESAREMAAEIVHHFSLVARRHHEDEELHVFPSLLESDKPDIVQAVQRLRQDHHWIDEDWRELSPHIEAVRAGQSWFDTGFLREAALVFTALMHDHIGLEESLVYPQARAALNASGRRDMGREMAARRRAGRP